MHVCIAQAWSARLQAFPSALSLIQACIEVDHDHCITTAVINQDLQALHKWGLDNKTTFEPEKMRVMMISQKKKPFDPSGIIFAGEELSVHDDTTLVGLKIDNRMKWGPMIKKLGTKARQSNWCSRSDTCSTPKTSRQSKLT